LRRDRRALKRNTREDQMIARRTFIKHASMAAVAGA